MTAAKRQVVTILQSEMTECGLASLAMVSTAHGTSVTMPDMRRLFGTSSRGSNAESIINMGKSLGLEMDAYTLEMDHIEELKLPAILHWEMNHFVVLDEIGTGRYRIHDPARGRRWIDEVDFRKRFTGIAIQVESVLPRILASQASERLSLLEIARTAKGMPGYLGRALLLTAVMQAYLIASPYLMQTAIDRIIPERDTSLLFLVGILFLAFTGVNTAATYQRGASILRGGARLSHSVSRHVAGRMISLPISWFEKRQVGDVMSRFQSVTPLQQILTEGAVGSILDGILILAMLAIMAYYSLVLTVVPIIAITGYALMRIRFYPRQRDAQEERLKTAAAEQGMMMETLRGMSTIRLHAREDERSGAWGNKLTRSTNAFLDVSHIDLAQKTVSTLLFGIENVIVITLGVFTVLSGSMSVGMIFAYMLYKEQFSIRAIALVDKGLEFRMTELHLERLSDIALSTPDASFCEIVPERRDLRGEIALKGIVHGYGPEEPQVIKGLDLKIEAGDHVAITGRSGSGKTTLAKMIMGLIRPDAGDVLVDGVPLSEYGYRNYHHQVAGVMQDDALFSGSIGENICFFSPAPDMESVRSAARTAAIDEDIMSMPMRYDTPIGDMGSSLSGGQAQRILLARALYRNPAVLVMDEGTAHLDAETEREVNDNLSKLGITRIMIAHRRETISAARRVISIQDGQAREA